MGIPATEGNAVEVLRNGDEIFPALFEAVEDARQTIDLLTFVYWTGQVGTDLAQRLARRAEAGVRVRVLLDSWGARPIEGDLIAMMEQAGVDVHWFRPLTRMRPTRVNHRTHRKVAIVDEEIAFTGGVGIADEWLGNARNEHEWRDTHFRVRGPAVDGLRGAFVDNWAETTPDFFDETVDRFPEQPAIGTSIVQCVRGASEVGRSDIATLFASLLDLASKRIRIATAYFVLDDETRDRLAAAAGRGVQIQILLPGPHADKRFVQLAAERDYADLLECGIEVWRFQPSMLHAKIMTVDGIIAAVGSANFNARSTACDEEVNLVVFDDVLTATLDEHFDEDLERSHRIESGQWEDRHLGQRVLERAVAPVRRLF